MTASAPPPAVPPPSGAAAERALAWSAYWAGGALHSCAGSFQGNYEGALRRHFQAAFDGAPADAAVLDLCCGNAPLAQLWLDHGRGARAGGRFVAVDAAQVAPQWLRTRTPAEQAAVEVRGGIDAARLPFPAQAFDLVLSQYGVEYVGLPALAEAARVLRPGGRFVAVLHHAESLPVRIAREETDHYAWRRAAAMDAVTAAMISPMARSATPEGRVALRKDARAQAARAAFDGLLHALQARAAAARWPDLLHELQAGAAAVLERARMAGEPAAHAAFEAWSTATGQAELRQRELVACALEEDGVRALLAPLGDTAARVEALRFDNGEIAGWGVDATRA